jgi:hypothetical protein
MTVIVLPCILAENGINYIETSAKTSTNVEGAFVKLITGIFSNTL